MKFLHVAGIIWLVVWLGKIPVTAQRLFPSAKPKSIAHPGIKPPDDAAKSQPIEGIWEGPLPVPGGELELSFSLVALTGGGYFAALDVPMQKISRAPVAVKQVAGSDSVTLLVPQLNSRLLARRSADGEQLAGLWCRDGRRTPVVLHHSALPTVAHLSARLAPPYREEEVIFPNFASRLKLAGTLTVPPGAGPFPAVVLVSDLGEQDRDGLPPAKGESLDPMTSLMSYRLLGSLADYLTRHGLAVLRLDDRGVGQSEGSNAAATPPQRAGDVQAALNFMRTRSEVDLLRLGLLGHGEGANVALLVAAQPLPPAFVVGLGAYGMPGYETLLTQQQVLLKARKMQPDQLDIRMRRQAMLYDLVRNTSNLRQTQAIVVNLLQQSEPGISVKDAQAQATSLTTPWSRAFLSFNPLESLEAVQCPVLLLTGQLDEQAPPVQHMAALEHQLRAEGNRNVTMHRLPNVNHLMQPPKIEWTMLNGEMKPVLALSVEEMMRQWLVMQLKM